MDSQLLDQIIKSKGLTKADVYNHLKISRTAYYRKCNGISEFTLAEIKGIMKLLSIDNPDAIFFADKVS